MAGDNLLGSPFDAAEAGDRQQLEPVAPGGTANGKSNDLVQQMSVQDFSGCCSTLMQDMKLTEQKDLLPLLVGVLQHVGNAEFAHGNAPKKRSGAFSKSVKVALDEAEKVEECESFRRLRRAALTSDARYLFQQELSSKDCDLHQVDEVLLQELEPTLLRFGFPVSQAGVHDALQVLSEQHVVKTCEADDEPCGF
mmetsp:Transcript_4727/g.11252  ORF Transcript_4727/g.11252 Transcript_4727/m.11252 type:complete len:195 (+) Transcript_4727:30-614(+)